MSTRLKIINFLGGCYAVFAIVSFMAAVSPSHANIAAQAKNVAHVPEVFVSNSQRFVDDKGDTRSKYWLTIWTTRNCVACEKQKALVPALETAGYNVIVRRVPGQRWIKSFPALVITKDKPGGDILHTLYGIYDTEKVDKVLEIGATPEEEEDVEDPDYDILQLKPFTLVVWLDRTKESDKQYYEIAKLRTLGFGASIYMYDGIRTPPPHVTSYPHVTLINNRRGKVICVWDEFVTWNVIRMTANGRT